MTKFTMVLKENSVISIKITSENIKKIIDVIRTRYKVDTYAKR